MRLPTSAVRWLKECIPLPHRHASGMMERVVVGHVLGASLWAIELWFLCLLRPLDFLPELGCRFVVDCLQGFDGAEDFRVTFGFEVEPEILEVQLFQRREVGDFRYRTMQVRQRDFLQGREVGQQSERCVERRERKFLQRGQVGYRIRINNQMLQRHAFQW